MRASVGLLALAACGPDPADDPLAGGWLCLGDLGVRVEAGVPGPCAPLAAGLALPVVDGEVPAWVTFAPAPDAPDAWLPDRVTELEGEPVRPGRWELHADAWRCATCADDGSEDGLDLTCAPFSEADGSITARCTLTDGDGSVELRLERG